VDRQADRSSERRPGGGERAQGQSLRPDHPMSPRDPLRRRIGRLFSAGGNTKEKSAPPGREILKMCVNRLIMIQ